MNYTHHYEQLIAKARSRDLVGYTETHHIVPRGLGGSDDASNLVKLTGREHFIAHLLLAKIYPKELKVQQAFWFMARQSFWRGSKLYEQARIAMHADMLINASAYGKLGRGTQKPPRTQKHKENWAKSRRRKHMLPKLSPKHTHLAQWLQQ